MLSSHAAAWPLPAGQPPTPSLPFSLAMRSMATDLNEPNEPYELNELKEPNERSLMPCPTCHKLRATSRPRDLAPPSDISSIDR
jgi:hypothetical protein